MTSSCSTKNTSLNHTNRFFNLSSNSFVNLDFYGIYTLNLLRHLTCWCLWARLLKVWESDVFLNLTKDWLSIMGFMSICSQSGRKSSQILFNCILNNKFCCWLDRIWVENLLFWNKLVYLQYWLKSVATSLLSSIELRYSIRSFVGWVHVIESIKVNQLSTYSSNKQKESYKKQLLIV